MGPVNGTCKYEFALLFTSYECSLCLDHVLNAVLMNGCAVIYRETGEPGKKAALTMTMNAIAFIFPTRLLRLCDLALLRSLFRLFG